MMDTERDYFLLDVSESTGDQCEACGGAVGCADFSVTCRSASAVDSACGRWRRRVGRFAPNSAGRHYLAGLAATANEHGGWAVG